MEKRDFRGLGRPTQEALRVQAVFPVLSLHKTQAEAAEAVGVSRQTVNQWLRNYSCEGEKAFLDRRLNAHRRGKGRLTEAEARRVKAWIADKCPEQLKLPFALWTAGVVRELIRRRLGKQLGLSTVQLYLLKWGFTPQKPLLRATQRSDASDPALAGERLPENRPPRQAREGADLLGRRDRGQQSRPGWPQLRAEGTDTGCSPDCEEAQHVDDFGGEQPRADAVHVLQGGIERGPVHRFPEPAHQGCAWQNLPDRRQPACAPCDKGEPVG